MELKPKQVEAILAAANDKFPNGGDSYDLALDAFFLNEMIESICDTLLKGQLPESLDETDKLALSLIGAISLETLHSLNVGRRFAGEISDNLNVLRQNPVLKVALGKAQIVTVDKLTIDENLNRAGYLIVEAMRQAYAGEKIKWQNIFAIVQRLHGFKASSQYEFKKLLGESLKAMDAKNNNETSYHLIVDSKSGLYHPAVLDWVCAGYDPKHAIEMGAQTFEPDEIPEFDYQLPAHYEQPTFNIDGEDPIYLKDLARMARK